MKQILLLTATVFIIIIGCEDDPVKPENHRTIIKTLTAFPNVVGVKIP